MGVIIILKMVGGSYLSLSVYEGCFMRWTNARHKISAILTH